MKFFNNKERALSIEITPLIDIVFLLVIFFVVTSKIETNQYLTLDLPSTESFSSSSINADRNIILLDTGILIVNNQEFNISKIEEVIIGIKASFDTSETIILSIENKAFHEWVITLMDELQSAGFQNLQIKTYTDQS
ncbi:biopolymer transporter ExbD [Gammaproteobacteria bacterium]|jgi:biopolymer transport protein ExbD|nr:biopolymer transporter ExbD [Gammaproteobacteria bacterium]MDC1340078.1 biopolymer transporter ExbD [bacterium]MDA9142913.1 biopolymer transporter ExbD [Gammaproteobacteria bacterium]MDA9204246.1 biopolymer transporter ExbD [Gammaproteobacteria bacterium]MDA9259808.1 biopolymer transporter ExbD [Gammaproteobacteria bacterium]|tara:strand:- start:3 stop:413 length:411 start_codon:yes stop_codon:yes gene_type:complete